MNSVQLVGRLTRDNELREAGSTQILRNNIAVQRQFKNKDGERESDFINVVAFGKTAELINQYFHKGSRIGVNGRIQTGSYTKEDGTTVYTTDVIINDFDFIDTKSNEQRQAPVQPVTNGGPFDFPEVDVSDNDLPF